MSDVRKPMTGKEYLDSLRDDREIWLNGQRVQNIVNHPAFRNSARSVARLYDALHDPKVHDVLTTPVDIPGGSYTHRFFKVSRNAEELLASREAIAAWARLTYGWMGRTPDYKGAFLGTLGGNPEFYAPFENNARRWYGEAQRKVLFINHALINPPVDRNKPVHAVSDVFINVEKETDAGIIVSGAKMVATGSALTNCHFVAHNGTLPVQKEEFALAFFATHDTPGVKMICRPSYELHSAVLGSPFDNPLSSRMDENDAVLIFDKALIPWENILVYRDIEKANAFFPRSGFVNLFMFHGCTRLAVKLDFIAGLLLKVVESSGTGDFRGVRAKVGEMIAWRNLFWALSTAMAKDPNPGPNGTVLPNVEHGTAYRVFSPMAWTRIKEMIEDVVGGGLIVQPSSSADFKNPELRPYLERFYRGSGGYDSMEKIKLNKLLWDAIGSEFGGRHGLYERNYTGNFEDIRIHTLMEAVNSGSAEAFKSMVEQCMSDYDLDGWTDSTWIDPHDVNLVQR
ncbi:4-hydroxyphenylacetate 3-hydroxylase N-terminal domain-containing protein [Paenibacillus oleatilyticus]|uniref:4-hydroxyphenylacetate 3-hydroxylase N-terminal domain-containing protein n=1 Tax=Paenibacillus oleatilyticus TaxID=2594886 RepID=UPI001C200727|nr:4-hydroxyphenylacetate 3-hydroxylase N-terminal domain-containing protein [Paenibacillus oleatilyticus]MBU7320211.1 Pyoverdin chromophore biosynthetic protein pvcC [Paenibacillus oleatilyticus]